MRELAPARDGACEDDDAPEDGEEPVVHRVPRALRAVVVEREQQQIEREHEQTAERQSQGAEHEVEGVAEA